MPLARVEVRDEYKIGAPELCREPNMEDPKVILQGVAVNGLVGVLRQLGDLAQFAAEVFHELQEEVGITSSRSQKLMAQVQQMEAALSPLEKTVLAQRSHLHLAYTAGYKWHARVRCENNHFIYSDVPQFIVDSYEGCRGPPSLHLLDRFDNGGPGSCLKRYSDPTLFKRASEASAEASIMKISKDENGRKLKQRRRSRLSGGELSKRASFFYRNGSDSMQPEGREYGASISSPVQSQNADFFKYDLSEQKVADVHDDIPVSLSNQRTCGSSSSLTWDDKTEIHEPIAENYVTSGITQEDDRDRSSKSFSQSWSIETKGVKEVNLETMYTADVKPTNEANWNLESCDINLDDVESETDQFVDARNAIGLEPDDAQSEIKRRSFECVSLHAKSNGLAYNNTVNESVEHDPILHSQKSPIAAYCSINGVAANSELQSMVAVEKEVQSALGTGESVNSRSPQKVDYIENTDIDEETIVESVSCSKGVDDGISRETVLCTLSSNLVDNKSGVLTTDRPRSSPESHKPAPQTSNVTPVMFWTNGGLLGLQPSKPPDCGLANVLPQNRLSPTENSENRLDRGRSICQENQECGSSFRKISRKIPPVASEINNNYVYPDNNSTLPRSLATRSDLLVNSEFQADKHQEKGRDSSHMFEFRNTGMYYRKSLLDGNENDNPAGYQNSDDFEQKNGENIACGIFSGRNRDLVKFGSSTLSPSASPPLEYMKMSFQPIDGFQSTSLKLKFPDGKYYNESRTVFPSFQLIPEVSSFQHNHGSDSDDDTFYRSSPSLIDEIPCQQSESNSEDWESGESLCCKDPDLYDTFHQISLTDSVPTVTGIGGISDGDTCRILCPLVENGLQNSKSCNSSVLLSLDASNSSFKEDLGKNASSHDPLGPQCVLVPTTQRLPPVEWCNMNSHPNGMEDESESMPEASKYVFNLKLSASTVSQQPKPAPLNQDPITETQHIKNNQSSGLYNSNGRDANQYNGKDELGDFLHQIRTRSFNLRPTATSKPAAATSTQANVQVTAILEKVNALCQAVGGDVEEDNGTWSDP